MTDADLDAEFASAAPHADSAAALLAEARKRILVLDGAMGTEIQTLSLQEGD